MNERKAMISQPMAGKTKEEIMDVRCRAAAKLEAMGYEVRDNVFSFLWFSDGNKRGHVSVPLALLARSLDVMSECHAAYFCNGWQDARGCRIEHEAAKAYGLEVIEES